MKAEIILPGVIHHSVIYVQVPSLCLTLVLMDLDLQYTVFMEAHEQL